MGLLPRRLRGLGPAPPHGGLTVDQFRDARMILWKGHCSVHGRFSADVVDELRATIPGVQILVHPECRTTWCSRPTSSARPIHHPHHRGGPGGLLLGRRHRAQPGQAAGRRHPDKRITFLDKTVCYCSTMNRIDLPHLVWALESLAKGTWSTRSGRPRHRALGQGRPRPDARPARARRTGTEARPACRDGEFRRPADETPARVGANKMNERRNKNTTGHPFRLETRCRAGNSRRRTRSLNSSASGGHDELAAAKLRRLPRRLDLDLNAAARPPPGHNVAGAGHPRRTCRTRYESRTGTGRTRARSWLQASRRQRAGPGSTASTLPLGCCCLVHSLGAHRDAVHSSSREEIPSVYSRCSKHVAV